MNKIKKINKRLNSIMNEEPIIEFTEQKANEKSYEMNYGLAQVYSNKGFREYMTLLVNAQMKSLLKSEDINDLFYLKGRIIAFKELLNVSKRAFEELQKIEKLNGKKTN